MDLLTKLRTLEASFGGESRGERQGSQVKLGRRRSLMLLISASSSTDDFSRACFTAYSALSNPRSSLARQVRHIPILRMPINGYPNKKGNAAIGGLSWISSVRSVAVLSSAVPCGELGNGCCWVCFCRIAAQAADGVPSCFRGPEIESSCASPSSPLSPPVASSFYPSARCNADASFARPTPTSAPDESAVRGGRVRAAR